MNWRRIFYLGLFVVLAGAGVLGVTGYRSIRLYSNITETRDQINYLMENGGTIGQVPADSALSSSYLEIIFGDDPELLQQLQQAVDKGLAETPDVREGEIAAIIVTYRKNGDDKITNVVAHVAGGFPLGGRKISMHRDGFFASQIDDHLWNTGDSALKFLGRDLLVWANNEEDNRQQKELIESIFTGEISLLATNITEKPMYYAAVLPAPKNLLPPKMRHHVRAMLLNGAIAPDKGTTEMIVLTDSDRGAALVSAIMHDLKVSSLVGLRTRFGGVMEETEWGPYVPVWWAYEMANTLEDMEISRRERTVKLSSNYERRMVNAVMKSIERFGRDYSQIKGVQQDKLDPRIVDASLQTRKPLHYWSDAHRWGPDWPFAAPSDLSIQRPGEESEKLDAAPPVSAPL